MKKLSKMSDSIVIALENEVKIYEKKWKKVCKALDLPNGPCGKTILFCEEKLFKEFLKKLKDLREQALFFADDGK